MGEKNYDAIYKIAHLSDTDKVIIMIKGAEIKGILLDCDDEKCVSGIITLKDAVLKCKMTGGEKHFKWLNIPACQVVAFTFQCCVADE